MPSPVHGGHITQEFGVPGNYSAGYHTGRDWAGGSTGDILATRKGKVTAVFYDDSYGNRVEILTEGIEHSYSHMKSIVVKVGQEVSQGHYLGEMGSTGTSTGPHCHYEERYSPYGYNNHRNPQFDKTSGSTGGTGDAGGYPKPTSNKVYLSKLRYGQYDSDSVWYLQDVLNRHTLSGGQTLPLTGNYLSETDEEVRLCQKQHGFGNDPVNGSYVGPNQANHLFSGSGLTIVNDL